MIVPDDAVGCSDGGRACARCDDIRTRDRAWAASAFRHYASPDPPPEPRLFAAGHPANRCSSRQTDHPETQRAQQNVTRIPICVTSRLKGKNWSTSLIRARLLTITSSSSRFVFALPNMHAFVGVLASREERVYFPFAHFPISIIARWLERERYEGKYEIYRNHYKS